MGVEAIAGLGCQLIDEVQIVLGGDDGDMPHVGGQQWQLGPGIGACAVPAQQRIHCKAVTIMPRAA